ncbi:MAG TPA: glutamine-hydrolyzing GMP synthase [Jeotgalicoccus sp.]|nr:glutamine-hydrolyzing GMP synthase [Jeotgalicoccus sp.]
MDESVTKNVPTLAVIDFGSQFNQLIARKVRELGVYSELFPYNVSMETLKENNVQGLIFTGGPKRVLNDDAFKVDPAIYDLGLPILAIDYGAQLMVNQLGGKIQEVEHSETEVATLEISNGEIPLFKGLKTEEKVWQSVSDQIVELPEGFEAIAGADHDENAVIFNKEKNFYGVQFHPEVGQTEKGPQIIENFAKDICEFEGDWDMGQFIDLEIEKIREQVGDKKVLLGLSGGVDSSVTGVLLNKAIGDQLVCIFVDHGLLRKNEAEEVMENLSGKFGLNIVHVEATERYLTKLAGVSDPEEKRKIIGNEFIEVFSDEARKLDGVEFLAQGTLYTDIIESGTETAETIKSHHNVGGLPEDLEFELIEPMNTLFKDEVRALGEELGMPADLVWRQPFPGPGLAVRVLGEITRDKLEVVRESDAILREEIKNAGLERDIWQYFTVLPGFKTVGVTDDKRTYDYTIGIRAINSVDGVTANWARIPLDLLDKISKRITNEVDGINRVVYDITSKPPATVEWE